MFKNLKKIYKELVKLNENIELSNKSIQYLRLNNTNTAINLAKVRSIILERNLIYYNYDVGYIEETFETEELAKTHFEDIFKTLEPPLCINAMKPKTQE